MVLAGVFLALLHLGVLSSWHTLPSSFSFVYFVVIVAFNFSAVALCPHPHTPHGL